MTSSSLLPWYSLNFTYVPFLALICIHANVLMTVYYLSPSGVSGQFMGTMGTMGGDDSSGITNFGTFLFCTTGSGVLISFND